jgi:hypothetical protein
MLDEGGKDLDMSARRDLRNHAPIRLVRLSLSNHRLREDSPVARHERNRAVIARRFEAEDQRWLQSHFASGPLPDPPDLH